MEAVVGTERRAIRRVSGWQQGVLPGFPALAPGVQPRSFPAALVKSRVGVVLLQAWHPRTRSQIRSDAKRLLRALDVLKDTRIETKTQFSRFCPWNAQSVLAAHGFIRFQHYRCPHVVKRPVLTQDGEAFLEELRAAVMA